MEYKTTQSNGAKTVIRTIENGVHKVYYSNSATDEVIELTVNTLSGYAIKNGIRSEITPENYATYKQIIDSQMPNLDTQLNMNFEDMFSDLFGTSSTPLLSDSYNYSGSRNHSNYENTRSTHGSGCLGCLVSLIVIILFVAACCLIGNWIWDGLFSPLFSNIWNSITNLFTT